MGGSAVVENVRRPIPQEDPDANMVDVSLEAASPRPQAVDGADAAVPKSEMRSTVAAKGTKEVDYNKLWYIHGQAYDLTDWLDRHPGGSYALLNGRGLDITALFESYHPFTERPRARLASFTPVEVPEHILRLKCVDRAQGNWFLQADGSRDPFWEAIRERCGKVVKDQKIPRTMGWQCLYFHIFLLLIQPVLYYFGYLHTNFWIACVTASVMGLTTWIAGRLGHDGGHYEIFSGKRYIIQQIVGIWAGLGLSNVGYWELLHTFMHHADTNSDGEDPDLYHYMFALRDTPEEQWNWMHRLQASKVWCYAVWSMTTAGLLIIEPLLYLISGAGTMPGTPFRRVVMRPLQKFKLVLHLLLWPAWMLALPMWYNWYAYNNVGMNIFVRIMAMNTYLTTSGFYFGLFSQVNHFAEGCVDAAAKPNGWAQRQVETAANFAVGSLFWSIITAGINVQIEHHLFPNMSSDRLEALVPVVKETCKEFNVDYKDFPTFWSCLASVHRYMDALAKPEYVPYTPAPKTDVTPS